MIAPADGRAQRPHSSAIAGGRRQPSFGRRPQSHQCVTRLSDPITLRLESELSAPAARVWEWITSIDGISAEMRPFLRMTWPKGVRSLDDVPVRPGVRMFRSYVFLFGVLPIDYSNMTLIEYQPGQASWSSRPWPP